MLTNFIKISTHNGEQRWINLSRVHRISLSKDHAGDPLLVFSFGDADRVTVHGNDADTRAVVRRIVSALDDLVEWPDARLAA